MTRRPRSRARIQGRRHRDDRGLVLVMFALVLVVLLVLAAMAVDLGQARFSRRDEQAAVDLAALDAGHFLAGRSTPGVTEPRRACEAAVESALRNVSDLPAIAPATVTTRCATLPATGAACNAASPVDVSFSSGRYVLTVRYPVPVSELPSNNFAGGGVNDGTDGCQRMRVKLAKTEGTRFSPVIGINQLATEANAVVRAESSSTQNQAPALLLLERTACGSLANSVNGSGNLGIVVEANGTDPGIIHADSDATTGCSGNTNDAYAIYGSPLSGGGPSISVGTGSGGTAGIIQTRATNGKGGATFPGGLSVAPTTGGIVSRKVMDLRYNSGSSTAITDLHAAASAAVRATTVPAGHTVMGCSGPVPALATKVYVDCDKVNSTIAFAGVTSVVFKNDIELKQDNQLQFPDATSIVVRGSLALPKGSFGAPLVSSLSVGDGVDIASNSSLAVNSTSDSSCAGRQPPAVWANTTRFTIFGGSPAFSSSGAVAMCQTTLYLAGPSSLTSYAAQQVTSGGTCSIELPCPKTTGNSATGAEFVIGGGTVILSAPNQFPTSRPTTQGLEDLALWTEGAGTSEIKSGGSLLGTGVHFVPNGTVEMRSPATGDARDVQFFARSMYLYQGTLRLKPDKINVVTVPVGGGFGLIR